MLFRSHSIPFAVDFATRGDRADGETCATARHAGPAYEIVRLNSRGQVTREGGQFASLACGTAVPAASRFNTSIHAPLRIRN